jgi:hypothetical protein
MYNIPAKEEQTESDWRFNHKKTTNPLEFETEQELENKHRLT